MTGKPARIPTLDKLLGPMFAGLIYIWIDEGEGWEPHITFPRTREGFDDAKAERQDLHDHGIKSKIGPVF